MVGFCQCSRNRFKPVAGSTSDAPNTGLANWLVFPQADGGSSQHRMVLQNFKLDTSWTQVVSVNCITLGVVRKDQCGPTGVSLLTATRVSLLTATALVVFMTYAAAGVARLPVAWNI